MKNLLKSILLLAAVAFFAASCKPSRNLTNKRNVKKSDTGVAKPSITLAAPERSYEELLLNIEDKALRAELEKYHNEGMGKPLVVDDVSPDQVIKTAKSFIGTPHQMGGSSKKGIDCSGLIKVSLGKHGIDLPHNSHEIGRYGELVPHREQLQKGDLVFFIKTYNTHYLITHSGIYLGNGEFIHASSSRGVIISSLDDPYYWKPKYLFGKRIFKQ